MKKYLNYSMLYAIAAILGGVFYRKFTKWNGFTEVIALGKVHAHLFLLGMMVFMFVALFSKSCNLDKQKTFVIFLFIYNTGVPLTALMMIIRGIPQVLGISLSSGFDAAISGLAGIEHILTGMGIILLLLSIKNSIKTE